MSNPNKTDKQTDKHNMRSKIYQNNDFLLLRHWECIIRQQQKYTFFIFKFDLKKSLNRQPKTNIWIGHPDCI